MSASDGWTALVVGTAMIVFGLWSRRSVDDLVSPDVDEDREPDEYDYRVGVLLRGATAMVVVGAGFVLAAVAIGLTSGR